MRFSLRPAGEKVAWAQPMTDEGDHGGAESLSHGLRSRWQLCCLTDAAYPLRVLRFSE